MASETSVSLKMIFSEIAPAKFEPELAKGVRSNRTSPEVGMLGVIVGPVRLDLIVPLTRMFNVVGVAIAVTTAKEVKVPVGFVSSAGVDRVFTLKPFDWEAVSI
jgi:hypothetical protein